MYSSKREGDRVLYVSSQSPSPGCRDVQCRRGVGLPVTALPVDVTAGTGPILGEEEAIKAGLVGPFLPRMKERVGSESEMVGVAQSLRSEGC